MWDNLRIRDFVDILIVTFIIHRGLSFLVGTRAVQLIKGFLLLWVSAIAVNFLDFRLLSWFSGRAFTALFIALPILFQPELRNLLEEIGRGNLWNRRAKKEEINHLTDEVVKSLLYFKANKVGALLVFEQQTGLKEYWRTAVKLEAKITEELIISLFWKDNPLHDGAVIFNRNEIIAGACYLPLSDNVELSRWFGTRHRAALGITDVSDALVLVVSEERGEISMCYKGHLSRNMNDEQIKKLLYHYFSGLRGEKKSIHARLKSYWGGIKHAFAKNR